jgi:putative IMPACT (imprinted ancient) family translation regulator
MILTEAVEHEIKIRRSRFIARLMPATSLEEAKAAIAGVAAQHPLANHNCWAYVIGDRARCSTAPTPASPPARQASPC